MSGFQAISYEYAVEMTYPLPEATSATLLNLVSQVINIAITLMHVIIHCTNSNHVQFISVAVVFVVGYLSTVYPSSVGWILTGLTALAALLSGKLTVKY